MTVLIGGSEPDTILDIDTSARSGSDLGRATITVRDTSANRSQISAGDGVTITRPTRDWTGYVTGLRSLDGNRLAVDALETRLELKHLDLQQVFYDIPSSEAVTLAVTTQAQPLSRQPIHTGDDLSDWSFAAPVNQLYGGTRAGLYDWGTDLVTVGAREGHQGTLVATYEDVTADAIQDGIFELETRLLVNDRGGGWDTEIELVTPDGTTYVWTPETPGSGFETLTLPAEEATTDGQLSETGVLQYRFTPRAKLAGNTAILIDNALTKPFRRRARQSGLSTAGVQQTSRRITRRATVSAGQFIQSLAREDQYETWVDENDVLHYEPSGGGSSLSIEAGQTPVEDVDDERDFESIRNVVTVQGDGDIEVTERDQASIAFYGPNPRAEPIVDEEIQSEADAEARALGFLEDNARDDATVTFSIADGDYLALSPEDTLPVTWPPSDLNGTFVVDEVGQNGTLVDVAITASSS